VATAHQKIAVLVVLIALIGALWAGFVAYRALNAARLRQFGWGVTALLAVQAALGIALAIGGERPADSLHFIYGPLLLFSLPVAQTMARGRDRRGEGWVLAAGWLVTLALGLRAVGTGGGMG
jgi:hypothetical protein